MHLFSTDRQRPFVFTGCFWWGGTFPFDSSVLKLSLNQVARSRGVPAELRSVLVLQGSGKPGLLTGVVAVAPLASVGLGWRVSGPSLGCSPQPL